jgi:archaemetzincin
MKVAVLPIGQVDESPLLRIQDGLKRFFPQVRSVVIEKKLPLGEIAFDEKRRQYRSHLILNQVQNFAAEHRDFNYFLGVVDVDIFVPGLNFVFGEAICPGKSALISLHRLKPEFYGEASNDQLYFKRAIKEAVHELGHNLGLRHCSRPLCVMHFSKSIFDTDIKQSSFCDRCSSEAVTALKG